MTRINDPYQEIPECLLPLENRFTNYCRGHLRCSLQRDLTLDRDIEGLVAEMLHARPRDHPNEPPTGLVGQNSCEADAIKDWALTSEISRLRSARSSTGDPVASEMVNDDICRLLRRGLTGVDPNFWIFWSFVG
jgi:hypothetical protein